MGFMDHLFAKLKTQEETAPSDIPPVTIDAHHSVEHIQDNYFPENQHHYAFDRNIVDKLIKQNRVILNQTQLHLSMNDEDFNDFFIEIIVKYIAKFTIDLPASEQHHNAELTGLFYHLIETANRAALVAKHDAFNDLCSSLYHFTPEHKPLLMDIIPMWAWLGGVLHDLAKPIDSMIFVIYDREGKAIPATAPWMPASETFYDYLVEHDAYSYKIRYNPTYNYEAHAQAQTLFFGQFLSFFSKRGKYMPWLVDMLPKLVDKTQPIYRLISESDQYATQADRQRTNLPVVFRGVMDCFIDAFSLYDRTHRISNNSKIPYYFSMLGIHIPFPRGLSLISQVYNEKFQDAKGFRAISDPEAWVSELGVNKQLLLADPNSKSYKPRINDSLQPFIHDVEFKDEKGVLVSDQVITIRPGMIKLYLDSDTHFIDDLMFATDGQIIRQKAAMIEQKAQEMAANKLAHKTAQNADAPTQQELSLDGIDDVTSSDVEQISTSTTPTAAVQLTTENDSADDYDDAQLLKAQIRAQQRLQYQELEDQSPTNQATAIDNSTIVTDQEAQVPLPNDAAQQLSNDELSAFMNDTLAQTDDEFKQPINPPPPTSSQNDNQQDQVVVETNMDYQPEEIIQPVRIEPVHLPPVDQLDDNISDPSVNENSSSMALDNAPSHYDLEYAIEHLPPANDEDPLYIPFTFDTVNGDAPDDILSAYAQQIPATHPAMMWIGQYTFLSHTDVLPVLLVLMFEDLNRYDLPDILAKKTPYRFLSDGFAIRRSHFDQFLVNIEHDISLPKIVIQRMKALLKEVFNDARTYELIISHEARADIVFTPPFSAALLFHHKQRLIPLIQRSVLTV